jgi:cobyrinic acid a,c-diamide synthase
MQQDLLEFPRLMIAALRGGSGKTILSIGIIAALRSRKQLVAPFKKGPDYIDAGWLAMAAGRPCYNLDTFMIPPEHVYASFTSRTHPNHIAIIEGNRGLYDGIDVSGSTSTAELAKLLDAPVILCLDATKTTRTMAAVVSGCHQFDPAVQIKGVILNRVAGKRHETILRDSIEAHCHIPVLGAVPKLGRQNLPERHMGLVPTPEHAWAQESIQNIRQMAENHIDLDALVNVVSAAPPLIRRERPDDRIDTNIPTVGPAHRARPKIGIIRDSAFQFYYPENIDALESAGA